MASPLDDILSEVGASPIGPPSTRPAPIPSGGLDGIMAELRIGEYAPKPPAPAEQPGALSRGFWSGLYAMPELAGEALEGFGRMLGNEGMRGYGETLRKERPKLGPEYEPKVGSIANVDGLDSFLSYLGEQAGQGFASTLPTLAAGIPGAAAGAILGGPIGAAIGGAITAAGPAYIQNYGDVRKQLREEGVKDEDTSAQVAALAAVPISALDVAGLEGVFGNLLGVKKELGKSIAKAVAKGVARGAAIEAGTEGIQQAIQEGVTAWAADKPFFQTERGLAVLDAMIGGGLVGGAFGGAGAGISSALTRGQPEEKAEEQPPAGALPQPEAPPQPTVQPGIRVAADFGDGREIIGRVVEYPDLETGPGVRIQLDTGEDITRPLSSVRMRPLEGEGAPAGLPPTETTYGEGFTMSPVDPNYVRPVGPLPAPPRPDIAGALPEPQAPAGALTFQPEPGIAYGEGFVMRSPEKATPLDEVLSEVTGAPQSDTVEPSGPAPAAGGTNATAEPAQAPAAEIQRDGQGWKVAVGGMTFRGEAGRPFRSEAEARAFAQRRAAATPQPQTSAAPAPKPVVPKVEGASDTAVTESGRRIPVRYAVVEADQLITSHGDDFAPNPLYPAELQPRDRSRPAAQLQVRRAAENLDPRLLGESPKASEGAPIIAPEGVVESGNGRVMAIRRAYNEGGKAAKRYRAFLSAQGYDVGGMKAPVLVRIREGEMSPEDRIAFAREANERSTMAMSATEQAIADARAMPPSLMSLYRGGDVTMAANRQFVRNFIRDVVGPADEARMLTPDGGLSVEGRQRIEAALLGRAYGDASLISALIEDPDSNIRSIGSALVDVAGAWATMRDEAQSRQINPEVDVTANLVEAVKLVQRARTEGRNVAEYVSQTDMFGGTIDRKTEAFLRIFFRNDAFTQPLGRDRLAGALRFYVTEARKTAAEPGLLGASDVVGSEQLLEATRGRIARDEGPAAAADLFGRREAPQPDADEGRPAGRRPDEGEGRPEARADREGRPAEEVEAQPAEESAEESTRAAQVEAIKKHLASGKRVTLTTHLRSQQIAGPDNIRQVKGGAEIVEGYSRGRPRWVFIFPHQLEALARQAGWREGKAVGDRAAETQPAAEPESDRYGDRLTPDLIGKRVTVFFPGSKKNPEPYEAVGTLLELRPGEARVRLNRERPDAEGRWYPVDRIGSIEGTRAAPVTVETPEDLERAGEVVDTEPSDAQKEAGNYQKGHIRLHGLDITIENPKGSTRSGVGADGKPWSVEMSADYGYVKRSEGADGEQVDVYVGPDPASEKVFVVDQIDPETGRFDEHKVILGATNRREAIRLYDAHFSDRSGPDRRGAVTEWTLDEFKDWLRSGDGTEPVAYQAPKAKPEAQPAPKAEEETKRPSGYGEKNKIFTKEAAEKAREALRKKLRNQLSSGVDPEILMHGVTLAGYHIEAGARAFADYSARMIEDLGEAIRPYLRSIYEAVRVWPGFDSTGMTPADQIEQDLERLRAEETQAAERGEEERQRRAATESEKAPGSATTPAGDMPSPDELLVYRQRTPALRNAMRQAHRLPDGGVLENPNPESSSGMGFILGWKDGAEGRARRSVAQQEVYDLAYDLARGPTKPRTRTGRSAVVGDLFGEVPQPAREEDRETERRLSALKKQLRTYASGMSRERDLEAGAFTWAGSEDRGIGVEAGELTPEAINTLARQIVERKLHAFVDSGAFSVFRRNMRNQEKARQMVLDLLGKQAPAKFSAVDFDEVLRRYDALLDRIARLNEAEESVPRPLLVMPDIVGDQAASLDLVKRYADRIKVESEFAVSDPVVPIQKGKLSLAEAYRRIVETVGTDKFIVGIPSNEKAVSLPELREFLAEARPKRIHFLGAASDKILSPKLGVIASLGLELDHLSADANILRSALYGRADETRPRDEAIIETLHQRPGRASVEDVHNLLIERILEDRPLVQAIESGSQSGAILEDLVRKRYLDELGRFTAERSEEDLAYYAPIINRLDQELDPTAIVLDLRKALTRQAGRPTSKAKEEAGDEQLRSDVPRGDEGQGAADVRAPEGGRDARGGGGAGRRGGDGTPLGRDGATERGARPQQDRGPAEAGAGAPATGREPSGADRPGSDRVPAGRPGLTDYRITAEDRIGKGTARQKAEQNLAAIRIVKALEEESRPATPEEKKALVKYVGWGASELANGMFPDPKTGEFKPAWKDLGQELQSLLTAEEYAAARRSTQYAHYTSESVINSIYSALERMGFKGGTVLEPGMGVGHFKGLMPDEMAARSHYVGIEFDPITANIAKALYPASDIRHEDFTKTVLPRNFFDVAIGNPPFAPIVVRSDPEYRAQRFSLHDYFFAKAIDRVRPGGLLVFITSRYTLDKRNDKARAYLADRADFLGAVRLPQTAFKENAGTEVVTDVIFLKKREEGAAPAGEAWQSVETIKVGGQDVEINEYFVRHPEMVLGEHFLGRGMYRENEYAVRPRPGNIEEHFAEAMQRLPEAVYRQGTGTPRQQQQATNKVDFDPKIRKEGGYYLTDAGELMQVENGVGRPVPVRAGKGTTGIPKTHLERIKAYIPLRDSVRAVLAAQLETTGENDPRYLKARESLHIAYDRFVRKFGPINLANFYEWVDPRTGAERESRRQPNLDPVRDDPDVYLVASIEIYDDDTGKAEKGPIFFKRTIAPHVEPKIVTAQDALNVVLNDLGHVDIEEVAKRVGMSVEDTIESLGDAVFKDPEGGWRTDDDYLSGNVRAKLKIAQAAAKLDPSFERNVKALERVQPQDLKPSQIDARPGSPWIPASDFEMFASEVMGLPMRIRHQPSLGVWSVTAQPGGDEAAATSQWGTARRNAYELMGDALNLRTPTIYNTYEDADGKTHTELDAAATEVARQKMQQIREAFQRWVWQDPDRAERLARVYNDEYNNLVPRRFNGDHLTLPGMSSAFKLRPHQKRAVWRILQSGNTYLAHAVGAGKAQPLDAKILTPTGWKRMGDIRIGDAVIAGDGTPTLVTGVFPQGEKEIFRVTFSDGATTECCDEHLWLTWTYRERGYAQKARKAGKEWACGMPKVRQLSEIRATLTAPHLGAKNHSIPMVGAVQFEARPVPLDPYLLGVLLGDGSMSADHISLSTGDEELIDLCRPLLPANAQFNRKITPGRCPTWQISRIKAIGFGKDMEPNPVVAALRALGLQGRKSADKFVPDAYLFNDTGVRLALLQGLLDTDGTVSRSGRSIYFYTASDRLADDVVFLVQSLGGTVRRSTKFPTYTHNGERRHGAPCHVLCLKLPPGVEPFRLSRKSAAAKAKTSYQPVRYIVAVDPVGRKEAKCISVAHPSKLYVTDDFIVTHNTLEMAAAAMELRRLGLAKKPMIVVPNHMLQQFSRELLAAYPAAKIMVADERQFHTDRRQRFMQRVATGDIDAVIVTHSSFGKIGVRPEFEEGFVEAQLDELEDILREVSGDDRVTVKRLERMKQNLQEKLSALRDRKTDPGVTFEEMGVDFLFVDEAHEFRKLTYVTNQGNIKGIDPNGSQMAWDLFIKTRWLERIRPGRNLVLASGTPITNTMGELFTLLRFLSERTLRERQIHNFDAWAAMFGETKTALELQANGKYQQVTRFAKFTNLGELVQMFRDVADVVTSKELGDLVDRPAIEKGGRQIITAETSEAFRDYQRYLGKRLEKIARYKGRPYKGMDLKLKVMTDGRHAALDMRFVDPGVGNEPRNKLNTAIDRMFQIWKETRGLIYPDENDPSKPAPVKGATQIVFSDLGTASAIETRGFSAYEWIKRELVRRGVPADEIQFIQDYKKSEAKARLFAAMRRGEVTFLLGTSQAMSTGVNVQRRLVALHHLDAPWVPADVEQREGRILRQGNLNPEVKIFAYASKGSLDATMWQILENKQRFIDQVMNGTVDQRSADDIDASSADEFAIAKAIASGDPRVLELAGLEADVQRLSRLRAAHEDDQIAVRRRIREAEIDIARFTKAVARIEKDIGQRKDTSGDKFEMRVLGQRYTERKAAGEALLNTINGIIDARGKFNAEIASIGGFGVWLDGDYVQPTANKPGYYEFDVYVQRNDYQDRIISGEVATTPLGIVSRLENVLRGFEGEKRAAEAGIAAAERQKRDYERRVGAPFEYEDDLREKVQRLETLRAELEDEGRKSEGTPVTEAPQDPDDWYAIADWESEGGFVPAERPEPTGLAEEGTTPDTKKVRRLDSDFARFVAQGNFGGSPLAVNRSIIEWTRRRGEETGNEYVGAYDLASGMSFGFATSDEKNYVSFAGDLEAALNDPSRRILVHHNHPTGMALSSTDIGALARLGASAIMAHGPKGQFYAARLTPAMRKAIIERGTMGFKGAIIATEEAIYKFLTPRAIAQEIPMEAAIRYFRLAIGRALVQAGVVDYLSSETIPAEYADIFDQAIAAAVDDIRSTLAAFGIRELPDGTDRPAKPVLAAQGVARLLAADAEAPAVAGARHGDRDGRTADRGEAGATPPGLAEDDLQSLVDEVLEETEYRGSLDATLEATAQPQRSFLDSVMRATAEDSRRLIPDSAAWIAHRIRQIDRKMAEIRAEQRRLDNDLGAQWAASFPWTRTAKRMRTLERLWRQLENARADLDIAGIGKLSEEERRNLIREHLELVHGIRRRNARLQVADASGHLRGQPLFQIGDEVPWITESDLEQLKAAFGAGSPIYREALEAFAAQQPSSLLTTNNYPYLSTLIRQYLAEAETTGREPVVSTLSPYEWAVWRQRRVPANLNVATEAYRAKRAEVVEAVTAEVRRLAPRLGVEVEDRLSQVGRDIWGRYLDGIVSVSLTSPDPVRTARHEVIHGLRELGVITDEEWAILRRAAERDWLKRYEIEEKWGGLYQTDDPETVREMMVEEAVAEAFSDYRGGNTQVGGPGLRRILEKLKAFFDRIRSLLSGMGFTRPEDVFERIESGAVGAREALRDPLTEARILAEMETAGEVIPAQVSTDGYAIYRVHYPRRERKLRAFTEIPQPMHDPAPPSRPSGMMRAEYADWRAKPWRATVPDAGTRRFATEAEARAWIAQKMPDEYERAAFRIVGAPDSWQAFADELRRRGYVVRQEEAKTTESRYIYASKAGLVTKLRHSLHSRYAPTGSKSRSHMAGLWEFSAGTKPAMIQKYASALRSLDEAVNAVVASGGARSDWLGFASEADSALADDRTGELPPGGDEATTVEGNTGGVKFQAAGAAAPTVARAPEESDTAERASVASRFRQMQEWARSWGNHMRRVPGVDEYLTLRGLASGRVAMVNELARDTYDMFRGAPAEVGKQIYEYLTTANADPNAIADETMRQRAILTKRRIDVIGRSLVSAGIISQEAYEKYKDAYLPRLYLRHVLESDPAAAGTGLKASRMGYAKARKDIPAEVRELVYGEIKDPAFLSAYGLAVPLRDLAIFDFLEQVSQNPNWAFPKHVVRWRGRPASIWWLASEAAQLRKLAEATKEPELRDRRLALAAEMQQVVDAAADLEEIEGSLPDGWKRIPDSKRYGMLRGLPVRKEIYDDVVGAFHMTDPDASLFEKLFGFGGFGTKATQLWKMSKVALNPPTQFRNFISNLVLLHVSGVPIWRVIPLVAEAAKQMRHGGKHYEVAKKYGIVRGTFANNELFEINREVMDLRAREGGFMAKALRLAAIVSGKAGDVYQLSEVLVKTAKIIDAMEREGKTEAEAYREAQKWLFDYSFVPRSVRYLRNAPIGMPFVSFVYFSVPRMLEAAVTRPWVFAPYLAVGYALAEAFKAEWDLDDDDLERLKKGIAEWMRNRGSVYILPFKDEQGRWQFIDLGYFFPWQPIQEIANNVMAKDFSGTLQATGFLGGPVTSLIAAVTTGKDPFTQRDIVNEFDPPSKQASDILAYLWRMAMPTWLTDIGAATHLYNAVTGTPKRTGEPGYTPEQAIFRFAGINTYPVELERMRAENIRRMNYEIQQIKARRTYALKDRSLTEQQRQKIAETYAEELREKGEALARYVKESEITPALRRAMARE